LPVAAQVPPSKRHGDAPAQHGSLSWPQAWQEPPPHTVLAVLHGLPAATQSSEVGSQQPVPLHFGAFVQQEAPAPPQAHEPWKHVYPFEHVLPFATHTLPAVESQQSEGAQLDPAQQVCPRPPQVPQEPAATHVLVAASHAPSLHAPPAQQG
jgi:hypothetical protein